MPHKFLHQIVHVLLAKHDNVIQALLLQRLDETLDEGVSVGRPKRGNFSLGPPRETWPQVVRFIRPG